MYFPWVFHGNTMNIHGSPMEIRLIFHGYSMDTPQIFPWKVYGAGRVWSGIGRYDRQVNRLATSTVVEWTVRLWSVPIAPGPPDARGFPRGFPGIHGDAPSRPGGGRFFRRSIDVRLKSNVNQAPTTSKKRPPKKPERSHEGGFSNRPPCFRLTDTALFRRGRNAV